MEIPSYYSQQNTPPRISEWFSEGFTLFGREWQTWTLQGLLYLLLSLVPAVPGMVLYFVALSKILATVEISSGRPGQPVPPPTELFVSLGVLLVGGVLSSVLGVYLLAGMTRTAAKQLRGEPISVGDLFSTRDVLMPDLGAYLFGSFVLGLAFSLCFIPGFWLLGLWFFVHPLIVEKRLSITEAFRRSGEITRPHLMLYILWAVLIVAVLYAGSVIVVGMVVTLPIAILMWMVSYRDAVGLPGALPSTVASPAGAPGVRYGPGVPAVATVRCPHCERPVDARATICPTCRGPLSPGAG